MKKIALLLLLTITTNVFSQIYLPVGRQNDPFVFCTEGVPQDNWMALNPVTGTWNCIACSLPVNMEWIAAYETICPAAMSMGAWVGPGSGDMFMGSPTPPYFIPDPH